MLSIVGATVDTDTYIISSTVPILISSVLSGIINNICLPYFSSLERNELDKIIFETIKLATVFGFLLFLCSMALSEFYVYFICKIHNDDGLSKHIIIVQSFSVLFSIVYSVTWSYSNAKGDHFQSELIPFVLTILFFPIVHYFLPNYGVVVMAYFLAMRNLMSILIQCKYISLQNIKLSISLSYAYFLWGKLRPVLVSSIYYKSDTLLDRALLAGMSPGTISLMNLSQQLISAGVQVVTKAYVTPKIKINSSVFSQYEKFKSVYLKSITSVFLFTLLVGLIVFFFPKIFEFLFYFSQELTGKSSDIWLYFILMYGVLVSNCIATIVNASFYSFGDTRTPAKISVLIFSVYLPIKVLLFKFFGINAMLLSMSFYCLLNLIILMYYHFKMFIYK